MFRGKTVSVIVPCLNEEEAIGKVLEAVPPYVDEVIVVDNNSSDRTAEIARAHGAKVVGEDLRGYGRAYKRGFSVATGDIIVTMDGDHSYPIDAISYLLDAYDHLGVQFVSASRLSVMNGDSMDFKHYVGNRVLSLLTSVLFLRWVQDSQSGMWVFARQVLQKMKLESDGMGLSEEIKVEAIRNREIGFCELPILYSSRIGRKKLRPWRDGWGNLVLLLKKRFFR
ncbi:MAG TPA: glycosyltransferase family 2 protein [Terriglobia bacterium]|nr:glycosyltransferase family 2 protein [Terriglobia bacterium]